MKFLLSFALISILGSIQIGKNIWWKILVKFFRNKIYVPNWISVNTLQCYYCESQDSMNDCWYSGTNGEIIECPDDANGCGIWSFMGR